MTESLVGKRLGKYEIQAEIGKGGMGVVYLGYDPLLDRRVALKVLAPHLVRERGYVERFLREARSAARLKHAGIVTIYDVGHDQSGRGNWYYIVMEYLEGQTLAQIIRQRGALPSDQALAILRRLGEALDYAHHYGLVHRDVKPGNVLVDSAGHATLADFGVARASGQMTLTKAGGLVGTPQYMSPEQALGEQVDHRTDIYALGVVAYEMLAGQPPFGAATPHAVLHQLIYEPPPSIRSRRPDLPPEVDRVLATVLAKAPASRYETATSFVEALGQALAGKGTGTLAGKVRPAKPVSLQPTSVSSHRPTSPPKSRGAAPQAAAPRPIKAPAGGPSGSTQGNGRQRPVLWPGTGHRHLGALWLAWLLASAAGWTLGWVVRELLSPAVSQSISTGEAPMDGTVAAIVGGATGWAVVGLFLGVGQCLVLRGGVRPRIRGVGWWVLATALSLAVVGAAKWSQGPIVEAIMVGTMGQVGDMAPLVGIGSAFVFEGVTGLVVGLTQWLVLQNQVRKAGRWVWISALAWAIGGAVMATLGWALGNAGAGLSADSLEETLRWLTAIFGGIVPGAIMATGLVRLLRARGVGA